VRQGSLALTFRCRLFFFAVGVGFALDMQRLYQHEMDLPHFISGFSKAIWVELSAIENRQFFVRVLVETYIRKKLLRYNRQIIVKATAIKCLSGGNIRIHRSICKEIGNSFRGCFPAHLGTSQSNTGGNPKG
jgi:hypothetical protein